MKWRPRFWLRSIMTGETVAALLAGSWRSPSTPPTLSPDELTSVAGLCVSLGAAPLGWWRIRGSALARTAAGQSLHDAFLRSAIEDIRQRRALVALVSALRARDVEPIVVKGWAIGRQYPAVGLRAYADHDLCVRRQDVSRARAVVAGALGLGALADLHAGFGTLDESDAERLRTRAVSVECDRLPVTVLAPEDHLRVLCRHLLRHGATRPLWLSDVAVAVETRPADFDWRLCAGASRRVERWIVRALQLAHVLLGASIDGTPAADERSPLPRWVVPAVLKSWSSVTFGLPKLGHSFDHPNGILAEVRRHWPNPLQATFAVRGPINALPRLPFQLAACVPGAMRATTDALQRYFRA